MVIRSEMKADFKRYMKESVRLICFILSVNEIYWIKQKKCVIRFTKLLCNSK